MLHIIRSLPVWVKFLWIIATLGVLSCVGLALNEGVETFGIVIVGCITAAILYGIMIRISMDVMEDMELENRCRDVGNEHKK